MIEAESRGALARDRCGTREGLGRLVHGSSTRRCRYPSADPEASSRARASGGASSRSSSTETKARGPTSRTKERFECRGKVTPGCLDRWLWSWMAAQRPPAWRNGTEELPRGGACGHRLSPVQSRELWEGGVEASPLEGWVPVSNNGKSEGCVCLRTYGYPSPAHELGLPRPAAS